MKFSGILVLALAIAAVFGIFILDGLVAGGMNSVADGLFGLFEDKDFPLLLAAGILAVMVVMLLTYGVAIVVPQAAALHRLRRGLEQNENEVEFAENFDNISTMLGESYLVGHAWQEFEETLVKPDGLIQVVQNTTRPQTFINYDCAQDYCTALRIMPHIPNYFVGVGLLLTFVGLVAALYFANTAVGGNVEQAVDGLQALLAAATFKFWTSIAGLLSSISLSFVFRLYRLALETRFTELCRAIEKGMVFATPQRIFVDVRNTIQEQLAETKKINTEMAMSIADGMARQLQEHMPAALTEAMEPLISEVKKSTQGIQDDASVNVGRMVDEFAKKLEGSAGGHMQEMSETLRQLSHSLDAMQSEMDSSGDEFARRITAGSERLEATMRDVSESTRELIDGLNSEVGKAGQAFGSNFEESLARLTKQSEAVAERLTEESREASADFAEQVRQAAMTLSASANDSALSSAEFADQLRASLGDSVLGVQTGLDRVSQSLAVLDQQLGRQGTELTATSERSQETARAMSEAAHMVRSGLKPFQEIGRGLNESSRNLQESAQAIAGRIDSAVSSVETVSGSLTDMSGALKTAWENYQDRFERVDADMERSFTNLHNEVENQQNLVREFVMNLDSSFDKALGGLSGGVDSINNSVEDLAEQLEKMNGVRSRA